MKFQIYSRIELIEAVEKAQKAIAFDINEGTNMYYIKVHTGEPFVIVCDGDYQTMLAYERLNRGEFCYVKTTETHKHHTLLEITLNEFMRLHNKG